MRSTGVPAPLELRYRAFAVSGRHCLLLSAVAGSSGVSGSFHVKAQLCDIVLFFIVLCYVRSFYAVLRYVMLFHVVLCYVMLFHIVLCCVILFYVVLRYVMLFYAVFGMFCCFMSSVNSSRPFPDPCYLGQ